MSGRAPRHGTGVAAAAATPAGRDHPEAGSAVVEFLGGSLLLLVPVVYLVLTLAQLQAGAFAVDGAAREAARALVTTADADDGAARAVAATGLALSDQGLDPALAEDALTVRCTPDCRSPGAAVIVTVQVPVPLPLVPGWLSGAVPLAVPVSATATSTVDPFASRG